MLFEEAKFDEKDFRLEEMEKKESELESEVDYYQEEANKGYRFEDRYELARKDIDILERVQHAKAALQVHKEMEETQRELHREKNLTASLEVKVDRLEKICRKLREENKVLGDKYARFEIMEFL